MSFSIEASNTVAIVERVASDAVKALEPLANELGMAAKYVFQLFVKQNYVHAIQSFIWVLAFVGLAVFLYKWSKKARASEGFVWEWETRYSSGLTMLGTGVLLARLGAAAAIVISVILMSNSVIPRVVNPQYYAIQDMVETGKALIPATPAQ